METCYYETVERISNTKEDVDKEVSWKYLTRQIIVCSATWSSSFCCGLSYGSPTVIIPQLKKTANSSDAVSVHMVSWLSSTFNYSGIVSVVILAILARQVGRKISFLIVCLTSLIACIILYYSASVTQILISEIIHGPLTANALTISIMVLTEYISPTYRGVFLTLKSAMFLWGVWVANAIGTFFHWKNIAILTFMCSIYSIATALVWPESPYWLANKNKFDDCATSHRWLKGCSRKSEAELEVLIRSRRIIQSAEVKPSKIHVKIIKMFMSRSFHKPILLSFLVLSLYHFSGKIACGMYSIDIIKRITGTESTAYTGMLILDGITILGMYVGCGLSKILKRRTLLLVSSTVGVIFLFCISLYLYLIHFEIILENTIISLLLLMGYSLTISVGPMIMSSTIFGELIPVKYRSSSVILVGCFANFLMANILKVSPYVLNQFGTRGLFSFFTILELLFTIVNYKVLPETKDKTILEIQEEILGKELNIQSDNNLNETDSNPLNAANMKFSLK